MKGAFETTTRTIVKTHVFTKYIIISLATCGDCSVIPDSGLPKKKALTPDGLIPNSDRQCRLYTSLHDH